jgi:hypothetical protein
MVVLPTRPNIPALAEPGERRSSDGGGWSKMSNEPLARERVSASARRSAPMSRLPLDANAETLARARRTPIARSIASSLFRPVTVKGRRSALRFSMYTPQRGWMTPLGFFMAGKIGAVFADAESHWPRMAASTAHAARSLNERAGARGDGAPAQSAAMVGGDQSPLVSAPKACLRWERLRRRCVACGLLAVPAARAATIATFEADADFQRAKSELIRLRIAEKQRQLIPLEEAVGHMD